MEMKVCTKCKKELTVDNFSKNGRNGLRGTCKECQSQYNKQWTLDNKVAIAKYNKQYFTDNKKYFAEHNKQWNLDNVEYRKQYHVDHKEHRRNLAKQWSLDNDEYWKQYRVDNKVAITKRVKQYQQKHLEGYRINSQIRRARQHQLPYTLTIQQWEDIKEVFNNSCCYCGKELPLEQEHFIALTKFGEYSHNNIICACKSCNSSKHDKNFFDWYPKQSYYSKQREKRILKYLGYEKGIQQLSIL